MSLPKDVFLDNAAAARYRERFRTRAQRVEGATYYGIPLESLSSDELVGVVLELMDRQYEAAQRQKTRSDLLDRSRRKAAISIALSAMALVCAGVAIAFSVWRLLLD